MQIPNYHTWQPLPLGLSKRLVCLKLPTQSTRLSGSETMRLICCGTISPADLAESMPDRDETVSVGDAGHSTQLRFWHSRRQTERKARQQAAQAEDELVEAASPGRTKAAHCMALR